MENYIECKADIEQNLSHLFCIPHRMNVVLEQNIFVMTYTLK